MKKYWNIQDSSIVWNVTVGETHEDNIEMSGFYCSQIVYYGVKDDGTLSLSQNLFFPTLRTVPNNTNATFTFAAGQDSNIQFFHDDKKICEYPEKFTVDGILTVESRAKGLKILRRFFPSTDRRFAVQTITLIAEKDVELELPLPSPHTVSYGRGTKGVYICRVYHSAPSILNLRAGEPYEISVFYTAEISGEEFDVPNGLQELEKRRHRISELCDTSLVLDTGISELDVMTRFAKLRAGESIFETLTGKYHSPGGTTYYAAIWCNDEIEYAGPHFAMTADKTAIDASLNAYRAYIPFMSENYHRLPSSVIAEGLDIWEGAGDRGDAAMYLYGASLFCLYLGDRKISEELYGAIKWCAEYCEKQKTSEGVIRSDTDELENRIPTDNYANLSTSSLCYGGLLFAAKLARSLGDTDTANTYTVRAEELKLAIENYFGAELHGFKTYRYSKGFDTLRAWICLPLCMGITERKDGTLDAMLSDWLWTEDGLLSCEISSENTDSTVWDRSTLYGIKCAFMMGEGDRIVKFLLSYCKKRLLCERVPYAVEAFPEGNKRHLSAESALFVRIITEGLLNIVPEGLDTFSFVPYLPENMPHIKLSHICICGGCFDIYIGRKEWSVLQNSEIILSGKTDGKRVTVCGAKK